MGSNQSHYIHKIKYNTHLILFKLRYSKNLIKYNKNHFFCSTHIHFVLLHNIHSNRNRLKPRPCHGTDTEMGLDKRRV